MPARLHIDPARLTFAETLAAVPMMDAVAAHFSASPKKELRDEAAEVSAELAALHGQLDAQGIQDSLPVTLYEGGKIVCWDGRHRGQWALLRGKKTVPCHQVTEEVGKALLESMVVGRRMWTKGQRAWLAVTLNPQIADNSRATRKGKASDSVGSVNLTTAELAARFGVSADLIDQAVKIHRVFSAAPSLKAKYEPGIWLGHGLGAVLAGIPGGETTADKPKPATSYSALAGPLGALNRIGGLFVKWSPDEKSAARDALSLWLTQLPPEFRLTLTEAVAAATDREYAE